MRTSLRACHVGKSTSSRNLAHVEFGIVRCGFGVRVDVDRGSKGDVLEGVSRALRLVEMESSMVERERRRKARRALGEKQN